MGRLCFVHAAGRVCAQFWTGDAFVLCGKGVGRCDLAVVRAIVANDFADTGDVSVHDVVYVSCVAKSWDFRVEEKCWVGSAMKNCKFQIWDLKGGRRGAPTDVGGYGDGGFGFQRVSLLTSSPTVYGASRAGARGSRAGRERRGSGLAALGARNGL